MADCGRAYGKLISQDSWKHYGVLFSPRLFYKRLILLVFPHAIGIQNPMPTVREAKRLPTHLRELCGILAAGLVRLRRHTVGERADDRDEDRVEAESSLHFRANQSGHANAKYRRAA